MSLALAACTTLPTESGFREQMDAYYRGPVAAVSERLGAADYTDKAPNGNTLYHWNKVDREAMWFYESQSQKPPTVPRIRVYGKQVTQTPVPAEGFSKYYDASMRVRYCYITVEADAQDRVVGYQYEGNYCILTPPRK